MVKELCRGGRTLYVCEICNVAYEDKEWAEKCQQWDEEHPGSCNLEIVQHGVPVQED